MLARLRGKQWLISATTHEKGISAREYRKGNESETVSRGAVVFVELHVTPGVLLQAEDLAATVLYMAVT